MTIKLSCPMCKDGVTDGTAAICPACFEKVKESLGDSSQPRPVNNPLPKTAEYLGDGVYLYHDGYQIWLATHDGSIVTNAIALEDSVFALFLRALLMTGRYPPQFADIICNASPFRKSEV